MDGTIVELANRDSHKKTSEHGAMSKGAAAEVGQASQECSVQPAFNSPAASSGPAPGKHQSGCDPVWKHYQARRSDADRPPRSGAPECCRRAIVPPRPNILSAADNATCKMAAGQGAETFEDGAGGRREAAAAIAQAAASAVAHHATGEPGRQLRKRLLPTGLEASRRVACLPRKTI